MPDLKQYLSDSDNRAGFFNPDTGEYSFSKSHKDIQATRNQENIDMINEDTRELEGQRSQLLQEWDAIEKDEMGEQRRLKPTHSLDPEAPSQKGKSGEEMVSDAKEVVAPQLEKIKNLVEQIDAQILSNNEMVNKLSGSSTVEALKSGQFVLSNYSGVWHILTAMPSKLSTPQSLKFLSDMQNALGSLAVTVRNVDHILDASTARTLDSFVDDIIKKAASMFKSIENLWMRRSGSKNGTWY